MKRNDLPYLPFRFFRLFCKPEWHAAIEGDLIEHYERNVETIGINKAYWKLILDVFRLFRPGIIRSFHFSKNHSFMFRHNILLSFRNFRRYKTSFTINVAGLSTGLACVMLIFLWVNDEVSKDQFHTKNDRLYQVLENRIQNGGIITRESNSGRTAEALNSQFPEVDTAIMTTWSWKQAKVLSVDTKNLSVDCLYAGEPFFRMFSFPLIEGDSKNVLVDLSSVVISRQLAVSLFGSPADAVGKMVEIDHSSQFQVSGVMDVPEQSSRKFDIVINFESFRKDNDWLNLWEATAPQTLLLLNEGVDVDEFNMKLAKLVEINANINSRTPFVRKFSDGYLYSRYEEGKVAGGRIEYVRLFSIIATFILVIACMNFMNLSTARATRRMKEVGIKKAVGARQASLAGQFLSESTLLALISAAVSVIVVILLLPQFNLITDKDLKLDNLLWFIPVIAVITGLVSGSYPALYLSGFKPALVLKGKMESMSLANVARKWLVVFQFTSSIVLITCVVIVYKQIEFIQNRSLGYNKSNVLIFTRTGTIFKQQDTFIDELRKIPGVITASASGHDMTGHNGGISGITWPGKNPDDRTEFERMHVDRGFIDMMEFELKEGRNFTDVAANETGNVIFNENAIKYMGLTSPIGRVLDFNGDPYTIIGVVKDFNFETLHEPIKPLYIRMDQKSAGNIMVKIEGGKEQETVERIMQFHNSFNPGFPFAYHFLDEDYQNQYTAESRVAKLSRYFAGLAIIISCLGLFGLAAFTAERRVKEIGIRKVLGSGDARIVLLLSEEFMKIMLIALAIAIPLSWFMTSEWLEGFQYRIELQWWYFAVSGLAALAVAWLAVSYQTIRASRVSPVDCLKVE